MTDNEIREWLGLLFDVKKTRRQIIKDLLTNSREDKMSAPDRAICIRALALMDNDLTLDHGPVASFTLLPEEVLYDYEVP